MLSKYHSSGTGSLASKQTTFTSLFLIKRSKNMPHLLHTDKPIQLRYPPDHAYTQSSHGLAPFTTPLNLHLLLWPAKTFNSPLHTLLASAVCTVFCLCSTSATVWVLLVQFTEHLPPLPQSGTKQFQLSSSTTTELSWVFCEGASKTIITEPLWAAGTLQQHHTRLLSS